MKHTRSNSRVVFIGGVGLMEKLGVRIVNLILAMPIDSLFSEPQILIYKMRPVDEMTLHSSNIFQ